MKVRDFSILLFLIFFSVNIINAQNWKSLIANNSLDQFEKLNGQAEFILEDGVIIGTSKLGEPNSFLATKKKYGDFILEFDVMVDYDFNSGVQFRSNSLPEYRNGRVHGYQVEIETSSRKWAGGIYDEARRGWLYPLSRNEKGRQAFVNGTWNHYRIEAIGEEINTWVNGIQCARLIDSKTAEGFIAFQVHSIGNEDQVGKKVMWKNIKLLEEDLENYRMPVDPQVDEISFLENKLTAHEKRTGWRMLWDGESTEGWRSAKSDHFPEKGWVIENGILKVLSSNGAESANGGDIVTEKTFSNFELVVDFNITEGANSGIKYFVDTELNKGDGSAIGLEFQVLDDKQHPDAKMGKNGNRTVGSLYDLIRANNLSEPDNINKRFNGVGQWNRARIVSNNGHIEHWLNGVKVVEYERFSQTFKALVEKSKYEVWPNFGQLADGYILLQDHGDEVWFKNIKIREW